MAQEQERVPQPQSEGQKETDATEAKKVPVTDVAVEQAQVVEEATKEKKGIDDILDAVDGVLEKDAQEFVQSYIQRGGE